MKNISKLCQLTKQSKYSFLNNKKTMNSIIKQSLNNFSFRNISFVEATNTKANVHILFLNKEELINSDDYESFRKNREENFEEFKKSGKTVIHTSISSEISESPTYEKLYLIENKDNKNKFSKAIKGVMTELMLLNTESIQVAFSIDIKDIDQRSFIINELISSNYITNSSDKTNIPRSHINELFKPTIIHNLNIFKDEFFNRLHAHKILIKNSYIAEAKNFSRDLANTRANIADCDFMESESLNVVNEVKGYIESEEIDAKIDYEIVKGEKLLEENMNLFYNVGKSSQTEPRLIILKYQGNTHLDNYTHCILGKGLTFDTGGINLKPTGYLEDMFLDKHGACNSLAVFKYLAKANIKMNIICALAVAENSIDSKSYRPSDIIKSRKGYTVEIGNTDAEGRLCLVDAMTYIQDKYKVNNLIEMSTLTGACMVALGNHIAGVFTNDRKLLKDLIDSSKDVNEPMWELPIIRELRVAVTSKVADLTNSSSSDRFGGASQAAAFLEAFVEKNTKWCHIDIAGPSNVNNLGTGFATSTILNYLYKENEKVLTETFDSNEVPLDDIRIKPLNNAMNKYI